MRASAEWLRSGLHGTETLGAELDRVVTLARDPTFHFASPSGHRSAPLSALLRAGDQVAAWLHRIGLAPGDVVLLRACHNVESTVAFLASIRFGLVVAPIPLGYGRGDIDTIAPAIGATLLISDDGAEPYTGSLPTLSTTDLRDRAIRSVMSEPSLGSPARGPDDPCMIVVTSGSTGVPKGVIHSHNSLRAEVRSGFQFFGLPTGPVMEPFPGGHIAGALGLLRACASPTDTVFLDRWNAELAVSLVEQFGVGRARGAPLFLRTLLDAGDRARLSTLNWFLCGGAPVHADLVTDASELGIAAFSSYGMSEHPTITSGHPSESLVARAARGGAPQPGTTVRITDDDGRLVATGEEGEISCRGPEQFIGYVGAGDGRTADGWFLTGDLGVADTAGRLVVTGRKKDIIIRGGQNISAAEIEALLLRHPRITDAAVIGVADPRYGERVCAVIVRADAEELTIEQIGDHFRSLGVDRHKVPERLEIRDKLPKSPLGKVRKQDLASLLNASRTTDRPA